MTGCSQPARQQGTKITAQTLVPGSPGFLSTPTSAAAVVLQSSSGIWKDALPSGYGCYELTLLPGESKYGVTVNCGFPYILHYWQVKLIVGYAVVQIFLLDTSEATELNVICMNLPQGILTTLKGTYDMSAYAGPDQLSLPCV